MAELTEAQSAQILTILKGYHGKKIYPNTFEDIANKVSEIKQLFRKEDFKQFIETNCLLKPESYSTLKECQLFFSAEPVPQMRFEALTNFLKKPFLELKYNLVNGSFSDAFWQSCFEGINTHANFDSFDRATQKLKALDDKGKERTEEENKKLPGFIQEYKDRKELMKSVFLDIEFLSTLYHGSPLTKECIRNMITPFLSSNQKMYFQLLDKEDLHEIPSKVELSKLVYGSRDEQSSTQIHSCFDGKSNNGELFFGSTRKLQLTADIDGKLYKKILHDSSHSGSIFWVDKQDGNKLIRHIIAIGNHASSNPIDSDLTLSKGIVISNRSYSSNKYKITQAIDGLNSGKIIVGFLE